MLDGTILSVKQTGDLNFSRESKIALQISWRTMRVNPDTCGRANSIWIRIRVDVEIFESAKKNLRIQKYPDTSAGRVLKVRSHCHFDKGWQRYSCNNGKQNCQKVCCTFGYFFLFISQTCCMLKVFFYFHVTLPSLWLFELPCKTTIDMRRFGWKADDLMRKGRRKRRPQLLANSYIYYHKCLQQFLLNTAAHLLSRILQVNLSSAF